MLLSSHGHPPESRASARPRPRELRGPACPPRFRATLPLNAGEPCASPMAPRGAVSSVLLTSGPGSSPMPWPLWTLSDVAAVLLSPHGLVLTSSCQSLVRTCATAECHSHVPPQHSQGPRLVPHVGVVGGWWARCHPFRGIYFSSRSLNNSCDWGHDMPCV